MRFLILFITMLGSGCLLAQTTIDFSEAASNKLYIKLYAHVDYNHIIEEDRRNAGNLDVHRVVTLFGYQFDRKTQFVTEIEVEHVKEIFVEQAFLKHKLSKQINLRAGLLLIPMGLVNEMHEPTFFYTVERPLLDKNIVPSTWSEIGLGISGILIDHNLKYQLYLINSPISYNDGGGTLSAEKGIRGGRQKGAKSILTTFPALSGQIEYFGFDGFKIGLSAFRGKTNTSLYTEFDQINDENSAIIDSSTLMTNMVTVHSTYDVNQWTFRGQYSLAGFEGSDAYNSFTGSDIPELMHGFYLLAAYDFIKNDNVTLSPFLRYSKLDNHLKVSDNLVQDESLNQSILSLGINYKPNPAVVYKIDYQFYNKNDGNNFNQFNAGIGVWF